jgi:hypothetical protein
MKRMNDKSYMSLSIDAEKGFDQIECLFMIKTLNKLVIEEIYIERYI